MHTTPSARIVVLDGYCVNPGDNPWDELAKLGTLVVFERTAASEVVARARDADILITNKTPLTAQTLDQLSELRGVAVLATGVNVVDVEAARARNIPVCNVPSYGPASVAQHTIALLLELCHRVGEHDRKVHAGAWSQAADFCFWDEPLVELDSQILGIIGYGAIGQRVALAAQGLGMQVWATPARNSNPNDGVRRASIGEIFRTADVVSLHCPLTEETRHLISEASLGVMKSSALLLNTARGALIAEADLARALNARVIAGAALDVLDGEPPSPDNPLLRAANCIITPHMAWSSLRARQRLLAITVDNVRGLLDGAPINVVNR
jgi:glycerate dehydrogenase